MAIASDSCLAMAIRNSRTLFMAQKHHSFQRVHNIVASTFFYGQKAPLFMKESILHS